MAALFGASEIAVKRLAKAYDELSQVEHLSAHQIVAAIKRLKKA